MFHSKVHIETGDVIIIFMTRDSMTAITVTPGEVFHNKFGRYPHDDFIGMKYGSKVHSPPPQSGYIYVLRPTPELWTLSLPHRTQILYMPDIAYITMKLGVRVGGKVIEAGTGSGSMTHSLARAVGSRGDVRSYEYHQQRYQKAKVEFERHGLASVHLEHRNVCKDGFGDVDNVEAVFLDLPAPWEAIPHAVKVLRPDMSTKICCFSPCLEQVLKTVSSLRAEGFSDISTQEVLVRTHDLVASYPSSSSHLKSVTQLADHLREHQVKKEERRIAQMRAAREKAALRRAALDAQKVDEEEAVAAMTTSIDGDPAEAASSTPADESLAGKRKMSSETPAEDEDGPATKRPRENGHKAPTNSANNDAVAKRSLNDLPVTESSTRPALSWIEPENDLSSIILSKPPAEMRGHTSYLTFATMYPASIRAQMAKQGDTDVADRWGALAVGKKDATGVARVAQLAAENGDRAQAGRAGSEETDYGSEGLDAVMGTMTEEEMLALQVGPA